MNNNDNIAVVVSNDNKDVTIYETINAIKNARFKNVFIQWYNKDWNPSQEEQLEYIRNCGLNVIFAHLGYQGINNLWLDNEIGDSLVERYKNDIKICKENNILMVVMHLTSKSEAPQYNEIGLNRLKDIVNYAKALDVKVAFENTKITGYLDYVIENIDNDNVGICFDSGHYHVHFNDELNFEKFKDRIFAVHLHDNDQSDDLHLMPFDGTLNWKEVMQNLKKCNYTGPITMELCYRYEYLDMGIEKFYKKGFEIGKKLNEILKEK